MNDDRLARINEVLEKRQPDITVVMENVFDPHNISAVMRTCDSVGIGNIHIVNTEQPNKAAWGFRSSAGAWKWINTTAYPDPLTCIKVLKATYGKVFAAHLCDDATPLYEMDFTQPIAIVFGNEQKGCSEDIIKACDGSIFIPQTGMVKSLNISVACAVILYEAFRQKLAAGHYDAPRLPQEEMSSLRAAWTDHKNVHTMKRRKA